MASPVGGRRRRCYAIDLPDGGLATVRGAYPPEPWEVQLLAQLATAIRQELALDLAQQSRWEDEGGRPGPHTYRGQRIRT